MVIFGVVVSYRSTWKGSREGSERELLATLVKLLGPKKKVGCPDRKEKIRLVPFLAKFS